MRVGMKLKVGVIGSAGNTSGPAADSLSERASALARALSKHDVILLTGGTTGVVYAVGKAAHEAGIFHIGVSPASSEEEHVERYKLPIDACDLLVYTGFGLKGRNVVLVRSCDIVVCIAGGMGSLNEFTIAHDEGKVVGCLTGTGGVADEAGYLLQKFSTQNGVRLIRDYDPDKLLAACLKSFGLP
jgi:uncharacterized protein (TIGR00725 family)